MKYYFVILGISLILFMSIQTHSTYGINGNGSNVTDSNNQLEVNEIGDVQGEGELIEDTTVEEVGEVQGESGTEGDSLNILGNATSYSTFFDMLSEGKTTFLNILNIKPHTIIKANAITCFNGESGGYSPDSNEYTAILIEEVDCDNIFIFEKNETYEKDSIRSKSPVISSKILTALQEGIERPISACVIGTLEGGWVDLNGVKCENLFIAYK